MGAHQWTKQDEVHVTICASDGDTTVCCPVVIRPVQHAENDTFRWIMKRDWKTQRMVHAASNIQGK